MKESIFKKYIYGISPFMKAWAFLAYVFYVPTIILGLSVNRIYPEVFPILKSFYKIILACQGQILGMSLFQITTSLIIISFIILNKNLNFKDLIKFKLNQFLLGIIFALFICSNDILFGILGTGKGASLSFLEKFDFPSYILLFFVFLTHGINAGIIEEVIFRGVMQDLFKEAKGPIFAIFATSIAFVLPHFGNILTLDIDLYYFFFIFFLGVFLSSLREKYKNLSFCFGAHIFANIFVTIIKLIFTPEKLPIEISRF